LFIRLVGDRVDFVEIVRDEEPTPPAGPWAISEGFLPAFDPEKAIFYKKNSTPSVI
jgi:hypothetical protein